MAAQTGRRAWVVVAIGALVALALALASIARQGSTTAWMADVTGEENAFEAAKGVVALALLELGGADRDLAPDAPIDHLGVGDVGVNVFLQLEADPENVRRSFAAMRDAGVTWARQQVPWEDVEIHGQGDFEDRRNDPPRSAWAKYDRIVDAAEDHGVHLLLRIDDPPDWAYADPEAAGSMGPPDRLEDYGDFVEAVVGRYCDRVRYYQVWNEPNIYPEWGERDVDPAGYAALLRVAAERARAVCPGAVIVSAALAQTTETGGRNMDDLAYLQALYDAGWQDSFDVLAAQGFGLWTGPTDRRASADRANFSRVELARDIMVRNGDAQKPVWITEMGWDSPPESMAAPYGRADEETRARYTKAAFERIEQEWPWAGVGFVWFLRRPNWEWHEQPHGYFRLLEPDWTETAAWRALGEFGRRAPILWRGRHGPWDPALRESGPWRDGDSTDTAPARVALPGSEVQAGFQGTGYRMLWSVPEGESPPEMLVVTDGEASSGVLEALPDGRLALGAHGLADGRHDLIVRVESGSPQLEEFAISAPDPPSPLAPARAWALLLASLAVLLGLLAVLGARASRRSGAH